MKKKNNIFVRIIKKLASIFDKVVINTLTKILIKFQGIINSIGKYFDRMSSNKSFLLVVALVVTVTLPEGVKLPPKVELEPVKVGFETEPFG